MERRKTSPIERVIRYRIRSVLYDAGGACILVILLTFLVPVLAAQEGTGSVPELPEVEPRAWVKSDIHLHPEAGGGGALQIEYEHADLYFELDIGWAGDDSVVGWSLSIEGHEDVRYICDVLDDEGRLTCRRID